jgi:predicted ATPase
VLSWAPGTYRDVEVSRQHPLAETLGELTREQPLQRIRLHGLNREEVGRFIEATTGVPPPPALVEAVYSQTEGNPLFLTLLSEVVRLLVQEGELVPARLQQGHSVSLGIPEGVREVIGKRLNRLSSLCNQMLTMAAVVGREFGLEELVRLLRETSEERVLELLEEALAARVLEEIPQAVGRYQFTHALIRATLCEEVRPVVPRSVHLAARTGTALQ